MANNQDPRYGVYSYDQPAAQHNGMNTSPPVYAYDQPSDSRISSSQTTPRQNYVQVVGQPRMLENCVDTSPPSSYLAMAILSCIFCFWPTGICAIVSAVNCNNAIARGDMEEARSSSVNARNFSIASIVVGVIIIVVFVILEFLVFSTAKNYST